MGGWLARALVVVLLTLGCVLGLPGAAQAHADLESSIPTAGQTVPAAPETITLVFNEPVEIGSESLRLLAADGTPGSATARLVGPSTVVLTPTTQLTTGGWVVTWRLASGDGHVVSGALPFAVGAGQVAPEFDTGNDSPVVALILLEAAAWLAAIAAGALLAGAGAKVGAWLSMASLAASALRLPVLLADAGSWDLALGSGETRASVLVAASGGLALVASMLVDGARTARTAGRVVAALALAAFAVQGTQSGHHLLEGNPLLVVMQVAHLTAAATWIGAVAALAADRSRAQALRTRRQATVSILVLLPCAVILAIAMIAPAPAAILATSWGRVLVVKVALVLLALGVGLLHHRELQAGRIDATLARDSRLRRFLFGESLLLAAVMVASATLTSQSPVLPASPDAQAEARAAVTSTTATAELVLDDGSRATVTWAGDGTAGTWTVVTPGLDPVGGTVKATHLETGTGLQEVPLEMTAPGRLGGTGTLPLTGVWTVAVTVSTGTFENRSGTAELTVGNNGEEAP